MCTHYHARLIFYSVSVFFNTHTLYNQFNIADEVVLFLLLKAAKYKLTTLKETTFVELHHCTMYMKFLGCKLL